MQGINKLLAMEFETFISSRLLCEGDGAGAFLDRWDDPDGNFGYGYGQGPRSENAKRLGDGVGYGSDSLNDLSGFCGGESGGPYG